MKIKEDSNYIYFTDDSVDSIGITEYSDDLWNILKDDSWGIKPSISEPRYIYSYTKKKYLHQIIMNYYYGEEVVKDFYSRGYIIEHLDNNGFNCCVSNLWFLLNVKNRYKGNYLDKLITNNKKVVAMAVYKLFKTETFEIVVGFNGNFTELTTQKSISTIHFLYIQSYEIVLQDAENILERLLDIPIFDPAIYKELYRFTDYIIEYRPIFLLTDQEKSVLHPGMIVFHNGVPCTILGEEFVEENGEIKHYACWIDKPAPCDRW